MSTYKDASQRVSSKLRDTEAWPQSFSGKDERMRLLYYAALAVQKEASMQRLPLVTSAPVPVDTADVRPNVNKHFYPAETFRLRSDFGIAYYLLDNDIFMPSQRLDLLSLLTSAGNPLHTGVKMMAIDHPSGSFFTVGASEARIHHYPLPALPENLGDTYPVGETTAGTDFELACSIVAAHVSGETIRDAGQVAHQTFLTQLYKDERIKV